MNTHVAGTRINGWRLFLAAHTALIERIEQDLAAAGAIPLFWYDVLVALAQSPEQRLRMYELAEAVLLSKSSLSRLVDRLEAADLLRRAPSPEDRRGAFAVLTEAGSAALERAWPVYSRAVELHFARHFDDEETGILIAGLRRILTDLRRSPG